jgi:hypothetical protein
MRAVPFCPEICQSSHRLRIGTDNFHPGKRGGYCWQGRRSDYVRRRYARGRRQGYAESKGHGRAAKAHGVAAGGAPQGHVSSCALYSSLLNPFFSVSGTKSLLLCSCLNPRFGLF